MNKNLNLDFSKNKWARNYKFQRITSREISWETIYKERNIMNHFHCNNNFHFLIKFAEYFNFDIDYIIFYIYH